MRVLVCGGRTFTDYHLLTKTLLEIDPPVTVLIEGGATGADTLAHLWAVGQDLRTVTYGANWEKHGRSAGPIRNQQMLDEGKPELVIAFPTFNSRGTWHMVRIARKAGVEVRVIEA